jgi:serine/threonine protein kinase
MGCVFSGPLEKTSREQKYPLSPSYQHPAVLPDAHAHDNPAAGGFRPYWSFASFLLQNDNPQIFEWSFGKEIGKGAMSRVFLCTNTQTGEVGAAKVYNTNVLNRPTLGNEEPLHVAVQREIEIMFALRHRYVLQVIDVIEDECSNSLIIFMPFARHGTLQSFVDNNAMDEALLAVCFFEVAEALRYVHSMNIVHRDLKPDNILVFSETVFSLSDFSVSTTIEGDDQKLADTRGSPAFLSPEECGGEPFFPKPADVWAYGVTLFSVAFHCLPFKLDQGQGKSIANTVFAVTQLLNSEELVVPEDRGYSPQFIELVKSILKKNPMERPTFEQIIANPWFGAALEIDAVNIEEDNRCRAEAEEGEEEDDGRYQGELPTVEELPDER